MAEDLRLVSEMDVGLMMGRVYSDRQNGGDGLRVNSESATIPVSA